MLSLASFIAASLFSASIYAGPTHRNYEDLVVTTVPDYVRPYVVRAYTLEGPRVGAQVYRFPVTGESSGGAFTLVSTAAPSSDQLGVVPHIHRTHYENFFCLRGRFQLWADKYNNQQARLFTPGDYGAVPQNTTHTFQLLDPINELVGVIVPGGFEALFYALAPSNYSSPFNSPFPATINATTTSITTADVVALEVFDVWGELDFVPRRDLVNGTAPAEPWHTGSNELASNDTTPFFVAKGRGPQYVNGKSGFWQIINPFITPTQSGGNFTQGTITMSKRFNSSRAAPTYTLSVHTALEVLDGVLTVHLEGQTLQLTIGDVVFVPSGTSFSYWTEVSYTSVLYVGQEENTLDQSLLKSATSWEYTIFPNGTTM